MLRRKIDISLYPSRLGLPGPDTLPPFFQEGLRWAQERDREFARLRTLTRTSVEEAGALHNACPVALDVLVRQLAAGDREMWRWVDEQLAGMRGAVPERDTGGAGMNSKGFRRRVMLERLAFIAISAAVGVTVYISAGLWAYLAVLSLIFCVGWYLGRIHFERERRQ